MRMRATTTTMRRVNSRKSSLFGMKQTRTLNIAPRKGSYKGMLQHRRFHIVLVDANSGAGDQPMQASKSVEYNGKAVKDTAVRL